MATQDNTRIDISCFPLGDDRIKSLISRGYHFEVDTKNERCYMVKKPERPRLVLLQGGAA
jgi:hypothetical protein